MTFWLGLLALGGLSLGAQPARRCARSCLARALRAGRLAAACAGRRPIVVADRRAASAAAPRVASSCRCRRPRLALGAARRCRSLDWALAGAVLYVLLPPSALPFLAVARRVSRGACCSAWPATCRAASACSRADGAAAQARTCRPAQLLPALVVYRAVYYLLPLAVALLGLVADEVRQRRDAGGAGRRRGSAALTELVDAAAAGRASPSSPASCCCSPARRRPPPGRLALLERLLPLGVIEASHFLGSVAGRCLLLLSQGLARRLDAAYYLTVDGDRRRHRPRRCSRGSTTRRRCSWRSCWSCWSAPARRSIAGRRFFDTRFSPAWIAAVVGALGASVWLGLFAFKHVEYSRRAVVAVRARGEASRFLRASVGAAMRCCCSRSGAAAAATRRTRRRPPTDARPRAMPAAIIAAQTADRRRTSSSCATRRCCSTTDRTAFVMYGVQGRTWVALGDPVGPAGRRRGADPPVPRALRRLRRRAGVLRGRHGSTCIATPTSA